MDEPLICAFATRGLEAVAAAEITEKVRHTGVPEVRTKAVLVTSGDKRGLRRLRTVDDVAVVAAHSPDVETLANLIALATEAADLRQTVEIAGRAAVLEGAFSVTVSAAHVPYGSGTQLEEAVGEAVSARYGWEHVTGQRAPIDVRVFADGTWALIGVRMFDEPLTRRDYRRINVRGALRPTVAAALVRLATGGDTRARIWDPFCGSATILCEAAELGHEVWGTDIDEEAVAAARENLAVVRRELWNRIERADSTVPKTWRRHGTATAVVSNPPWGKQVRIESKQALYGTVGTGVAEIAQRGGCGVLLTTEPQPLLRGLRRKSGLIVEESRIGLLGQTPTILVVRRDPGR